MGTIAACCKEIIQSTAEAIFLSEGIPNLMPQQHPPALCPIEKLDMVNTFRGTEQCRSIAQADKQGFLQVTHNGVTWKVFVSQGKLCYAYYSVQTLDTFNYHLAQLGHEAITQLEADMDSMNPASWGNLNATVDHLHQQGKLDAAAQAKLKNAIAKDTLETLLWLPAGETEWHDLANVSVSDDMPVFSQVLDELETRLKSWQALTPHIESPHQQPYCVDAAKLSAPVANGMLNPGLLSMLSKLMQNRSISELSIFLRQDSLKVAQLLSPYVQSGVIQLRDAAAPLNLLPNIPALASAAAPGHSGSSKRQKIVCIDDSPAMLETIEGYLGSEGFDVATVENPMESLSTMFSMKPDLILMDVSMPGINGNSLCQILKRSSVFKEVPIIMVSGNTGALDKAKAESSGATDYLTKPFSKADLLAIVDTHLKAAMAS